MEYPEHAKKAVSRLDGKPAYKGALKTKKYVEIRQILHIQRPQNLSIQSRDGNELCWAWVAITAAHAQDRAMPCLVLVFRLRVGMCYSTRLEALHEAWCYSWHDTQHDSRHKQRWLLVLYCSFGNPVRYGGVRKNGDWKCQYARHLPETGARVEPSFKIQHKMSGGDANTSSNVRKYEIGNYALRTVHIPTRTSGTSVRNGTLRKPSYIIPCTARKMYSTVRKCTVR